jgi:hypothetical protein
MGAMLVVPCEPRSVAPMGRSYRKVSIGVPRARGFRRSYKAITAAAIDSP